MEENKITDDAIRNLLRQEALPEVPADFTLRVMQKLEQAPKPFRSQPLIPPGIIIAAVIMILASLFVHTWQNRNQLEWKRYGFMVKAEEWMRGLFIPVDFSVSTPMLYLLIICCLFFSLQLMYIRSIMQRR